MPRPRKQQISLATTPITIAPLAVYAEDSSVALMR